MRISSVVSVLCLLSSLPTSSLAYEKEIKGEAAALAEKIAKTGRTTVAVVDFTDLQGNVTELGRFLAEEFSVALAESGKGFEIIDRTHLKTILQENKLSTTGLIDPSTARKLGKLAGVQALITGTITPLGETVRLTLKTLDTETAKVTVSSALSIPQTDAIRELLQRGIEVVTVGDPVRPAHPGGRSQQVVESGQVSFALQGCQQSGSSIRCRLLITSRESDLRINLSEGSRAFDENGDEYRVSWVQIGNEKSLSYYGVGSVSKDLIAKVPTLAVLSFDGVPPEARKFAVLEIVGRDLKVQFRDIALSR